jgi:hypothetical protein
VAGGGLLASDLLAQMKGLCLQGDLARTEPKRLRYTLLHTAGLVVRSVRRTTLRLGEGWLWADDLVEHGLQGEGSPRGRGPLTTLAPTCAVTRTSSAPLVQSGNSWSRRTSRRTWFPQDLGILAASGSQATSA